MGDVVNGADVSSMVDLTSDLDGDISAPSGTVPNNGGGDARQTGTTSANNPTDTSHNNRPSKVPAPAAAPAPAAGEPSTVRDALKAAFNRDPSTGQFAPKPAEGQQAAAAAPQGTEGAPAGQEGQQAAAAAPQGQISPPPGMTPQQADQFRALPAETQQFVAATMASVNERHARVQEYEGLEGVLGQRRQALAMNGMTTAQYVGQLTALSDFAGQNPTEFIRWFAGQQGLDLAQVHAGAPSVDPQYQALQNQLATMQSQVQQFTQGQQHAAHQQTVSEVSNFASEKDQAGKPLRPYFDQIAGEIQPHIMAIKAENPNLSNSQVLSAAYDRACWANAHIRTQLLAAQEAERLAGQRAQAERARSAAASVTGAPGSPDTGTGNVPGTGSVRDILRQQFAQLNS